MAFVLAFDVYGFKVQPDTGCSGKEAKNHAIFSDITSV